MQPVRRGEIGSDLIRGRQRQYKTYLKRGGVLFAFLHACVQSVKKREKKLYQLYLAEFTALHHPFTCPWILLISASLFIPAPIMFFPQLPFFHMHPSPAEQRVTLPLLAGRGKCAPLWQMNDVKQTYLYSFRTEEEENPSVTDVIGTAMCECACI